MQECRKQELRHWSPVEFGHFRVGVLTWASLRNLARDKGTKKLLIDKVIPVVG
jgi:hypothetical protein